MTGKALAWSLLTATIIVMVAGYIFATPPGNMAQLNVRLDQVVPVGKRQAVSCSEIAAARPLVLLALGQSNAGNHGSPAARATDTVTLFAEGVCMHTTDPLPGATGTAGSIWHLLPALLTTEPDARPVVLSVLAIESTSIEDWTAAQSPLRKRLASHVGSMIGLGLAPSLILWQQGEADALKGTSKNDYQAQLRKLAELLNEAGSHAPIYLARSTICQSTPSAPIRSAIEEAVASDQRFQLGPDTDTLSNESFRNKCHLTADGLDRAASMWAMSISTEK